MVAAARRNMTRSLARHQTQKASIATYCTKIR
jgi:hypothetical protein